MGPALYQCCRVALGQVGHVAGRVRAPFPGPVEPAEDVGVGEHCSMGRQRQAQGSLGVSQMEWGADRQPALGGDRVPIRIKGSLWSWLPSPLSCQLETSPEAYKRTPWAGQRCLLKAFYLSSAFPSHFASLLL